MLLYDQYNGPFQECWRSVTQEANRHVSETLCGSIERLPGNFINSTMTKEIQRDGNSSGRCHHASRCTQSKPSVGCSVNWHLLKYWRSAGGAHAGLPVTQRKVPFYGTPGVGETPRRALRRARLQLLFESCWGKVCPFERALMGICFFCLWAERGCHPARKWRSWLVQSIQTCSAHTAWPPPSWSHSLNADVI